jgi:alkylation response protein AidB-like acyl-CoA dehydrogenase
MNVATAKSRIGKAARLISQKAVQIHGGIGMTDELDVGHFFKRLSTMQYMFASTAHHTQRFASL